MRAALVGVTGTHVVNPRLAEDPALAAVRLSFMIAPPLTTPGTPACEAAALLQSLHVANGLSSVRLSSAPNAATVESFMFMCSIGLEEDAAEMLSFRFKQTAPTTTTKATTASNSSADAMAGDEANSRVPETGHGLTTLDATTAEAISAAPIDRDRNSTSDDDGWGDYESIWLCVALLVVLIPFLGLAVRFRADAPVGASTCSVSACVKSPAIGCSHRNRVLAWHSFLWRHRDAFVVRMAYTIPDVDTTCSAPTPFAPEIAYLLEVHFSVRLMP